MLRRHILIGKSSLKPLRQQGTKHFSRGGGEEFAFVGKNHGQFWLVAHWVKGLMDHAVPTKSHDITLMMYVTYKIT